MRNHPLLTPEQKERYKGFLEFAATQVEPHADQWDKDQAVPRSMIETCAEAGLVGGFMPEEFGGGGWDAVSFGLLNEAIGSASSSLCGLFTVQNMVAGALIKWGTKEQKEKWLPSMAKGEVIAAFAMTEPKVGSDIESLETRFTRNGDDFKLSGTKKWITYSGLADIFLVFGSCETESMVCIIPSDLPGITVTPLRDMLGFKGAHLSQLDFDDVEVPADAVVGKVGLGTRYVAPYGLHYGRISTAWSSVGLLRACLETATTFATQRRAFDQMIMDHGAIRQILADMSVDLEAAQYLCLGACMAEDAKHPKAMEKTLTAKYFASRAAARGASNTVQIMGAAGCHEENRAAGFYRNAKIMQIIEGTDQVLQKVLGKSACKKYGKKS